MNKVVLLLFFLSLNELPLPEPRLSPSEAREKFSIILNQQGLDSAIHFMDGYLTHSQDYHTLYAIGWGEFLRGNFGDAEQIASHLIQQQQPIDESLLAAAAYLMGSIYTHDEISRTDPLPLLHQALDFYKAQNSVKGVFRTEIALGTAHLALKDLEEANRYLMLAFQFAIENKLDLLPYHNLAYMVHFEQGSYRKAKRHMIKVLKTHQESNHIVGVREAELNLATICLYLGETKEATVYNSQTIDFFYSQKDVSRYKVGLINNYFINNCKIDDFEDGIDSIIEYTQSEDVPQNIRKIFSDLQFICH
jgi:tetratricopeptide (TPR) repeat protein